MNPQLQKLVQKIDALSLRERVILFVAITFTLVFAVNKIFLEPQFARQKQLAEMIRLDQLKINELQSSIQQRIKAREIDPDAAEKARLQALRQRLMQSQAGLQDMQKGLVSPERMPALLEDILKRNGRLQLVGLKTLPVTAVNDTEEASAKPADKTASAKANAGTPQTEGHIYKHGVEITLQGNYRDMVSYMTELESMSWRLFWGKAKLNVDEYPKATLTLTLFTLSLDKKWLNL